MIERTIVILLSWITAAGIGLILGLILAWCIGVLNTRLFLDLLVIPVQCTTTFGMGLWIIWKVNNYGH